MPWRTMINSELPIIEVCFDGVVDRDELFSGAEDALALLSCNSIHKVLVDCTGFVGGHTHLDLFDLAELVEQRCNTLEQKEAILFKENPEIASHLDFWKTTCQFRNLKVNLFTDRQSAIEWLMWKG